VQGHSRHRSSKLVTPGANTLSAHSVFRQLGKSQWAYQHLSQQDAVQRLAELPGLGVDSAHQIIAEVGASAATFPSDKHLASWIGACPGDEESAEYHATIVPQKGTPT
jgi:transposase